MFTLLNVIRQDAAQKLIINNCSKFEASPIVSVMWLLSDEDGNINPYATYPFNRSAESPPDRLMSQADGQRRSLMSHVDNATAATSVHRPERLETVRVEYFDVSSAAVPHTCSSSFPDKTECAETSRSK